MASTSGSPVPDRAPLDRTSFLAAYGAPLTAFTEMSRTVGARADYVQGGGGNTSAKFGEGNGLMAIKASGFRLSDIAPDAAYAVIDGAAVRRFYEAHEEADFEDVEKAGSEAAKAATLAVDGMPALRPSVEVGFHSLLDRYVVHSHSVYANLAGCVEGAPALLAQAFDGAPYSYGFVPYVDPGARLTFRIRDELRRVAAATGKRPAVLILQNHGPIAHHDDPAEAVAIHADLNARLAALYGLSGDAFPPVAVAPAGEGLWRSATPYLADALRSGRYDRAFFLERPLYPDQMVFLVGTFDIGAGTPAEGACLADPAAGTVLYRMPEATARTIEETLSAVAFIAEHARRSGRTLSTMGEAARRFIANWESEKYRKTLAQKGGTP